MTRPFTGRKMAAVLVVFFAIVVGVNLVMARFAIGTFGGTVVDNSYVASQNYNRLLAQADKQAELDWKPTISINSSRRVAVSVSKGGVRLNALTAKGLAVHPLGRAPSIVLVFDRSLDGALLARQALPAGRWRVQVTVRSGLETAIWNTPVQ